MQHYLNRICNILLMEVRCKINTKYHLNYEAIRRVIFSDFLIRHEKSKVRGQSSKNFQRLHLNYSFPIDFQGLENGRSFSPKLSKAVRTLTVTLELLPTGALRHVVCGLADRCLWQTQATLFAPCIPRPTRF